MYDKLLVAVDQSPYSDRAVVVACDLARLSGGTVLVLHVKPVVQGNPGGTIDLETKSAVKKLLARVTAVFKTAGVMVTPETRSAQIIEVADEIVAAASEFGADVIVLGARGDTGVTSLVPGSVTHKVLRLARQQVLVVP
jgi:nucleotide-binding universal stress UspA family protein